MLAGGTTVAAEVTAVVELAADVAIDSASAVEDGAVEDGTVEDGTVEDGTVEDGTTAVPVPVGPAPPPEPGTG